MRTTAYRVLRLAVRGRKERGGPWGEAVLAEFDQTAATAAGAIYVLGDNREAARDSRRWGVISEDTVTGRVVV